jgi:glycosyltransferase involved in cell wall biosynthesis
MKVLHLMSGDINSGAGKGAFRLHKGLLEIGVDSVLVQSTKYEKTENNILINYIFTKLKNKVNTLHNRYLLDYISLPLIFSLGKEPINVFSGIELSQFDVIHLHWINGSMSINHISDTINKYGSKVVLTYRDMWMFTGGCHYSLTCDGYKVNDCANCPLFDSEQVKNRVKNSFAHKKKGFANLNVIAISDWMKKEAIKSNILNKHQITTIYNSVDTSVFFPSTFDLRKKYNISNNKPIVLAGAQNLSHAYKGGNIIAQLFEKYKGEVNFVFFGNGISSIVGNDISNHQNFGFVDDVTLAELYSMADLFLMLSTQEAFGKTTIESIACGTPVLTIKGTGADEITSVLDCNLSMVVSDQNLDLLAVIEQSKQFDFDVIHPQLDALFSLGSVAKAHQKLYLNL